MDYETVVLGRVLVQRPYVIEPTEQRVYRASQTWLFLCLRSGIRGDASNSILDSAGDKFRLRILEETNELWQCVARVSPHITERIGAGALKLRVLIVQHL